MVEVPMHARLFVAIDQCEVRHSVVEFVARFAAGTPYAVQVFHGIEFVGRGCAAPLETRHEAELVVEEAVFNLRMSGVGADGAVRKCFKNDLGHMIVTEAGRWGADMIVVGGRRSRGPGRLFGHGIRERVLRRSPLPVMVAPTSDGLARRPGQGC